MPYVHELKDVSGNKVSYDSICLDHTKHVVNKIRKLGWKVLSYYIRGYNHVDGDTSIFKGFSHMYGKDAKDINVENINQIIYTINEKLTEKVLV